MDDGHLADLLYTKEDRLPRDVAAEIARRPTMVAFLGQILTDKQSWLAELPEWWAVVHASYILGLRGGEEAVQPLLSALRWADAFDCDWVGEVLPSILGVLGPPAIAGLTAVTRDITAGWSARDIAMQGLAAISLRHPESAAHVFHIIGERFMDEGEDRLVRQLAGRILLDFRCQNYRLALLKFAREEAGLYDTGAWYNDGFSPEEVEWAFHQSEPEPWHYQEDWMHFYEPSEIQRRQKRWAREHLSRAPGGRERVLGVGGGRVLSFGRMSKKPEGNSPPEGTDPQGPAEQ
jgi:hypothetical protein